MRSAGPSPSMSLAEPGSTQSAASPWRWAPPTHRQRSRRHARQLLTRDARALIASLVAAAGGLAVIAFWWVGEPTENLTTFGGQVTAAGQITGFIGAYLLLVEVALMARIPWLERGIGSDWLAVAHRQVGAYLLVMLVAHTLLTVLGYAGGRLADTPAEAVDLVVRTPNVLAATAALGLFVAVGVLSARMVRRRLAYETWYFLHLYMYLAIILAFAHQLSAGQHFSANPTVRAAWTIAHLAVAAAVLTFRVGAPLLLWYRHQLRVAAVKPEAGGAVSIFLSGRRLNSLPAEPGQFFRWRFLTRDGWWQAHPFSLSAAPNQEWLRITVGALGDHTAALQRLRPGVAVLAEGPYGAFTTALRTRRKVLLVAGGIGITPLRALLDPMRGSERDLILLYRASRQEDVVFREELEWMQREGRLTVHYLLGPRDARPRPLSPYVIRDLVPGLGRRDVFLCGPPGLIRAAHESLRAAGVARRRIHCERFDM